MGSTLLRCGIRRFCADSDVGRLGGSSGLRLHRRDGERGRTSTSEECLVGTQTPRVGSEGDQHGPGNIGIPRGRRLARHARRGADAVLGFDVERRQSDRDDDHHRDDPPRRVRRRVRQPGRGAVVDRCSSRSERDHDSPARCRTTNRISRDGRDDRSIVDDSGLVRRVAAARSGGGSRWRTCGNGTAGHNAPHGDHGRVAGGSIEYGSAIDESPPSDIRDSAAERQRCGAARGRAHRNYPAVAGARRASRSRASRHHRSGDDPRGACSAADADSDCTDSAATATDDSAAPTAATDDSAAATDDPGAPAATTDNPTGAATDDSAGPACMHRFQMSLTLVLSRERLWMRSSAPMMGTTAEVLIDGDASMVRAAFARLRTLESILTRFRPDSDLNHLHTHPGEWVRVSTELFDAFVWSDRMYRETRGLFDPTIRTSLESSGYASSFSHIADDDRVLDLPIPAPGFDRVDIDRATRSLRIAPGVSVDLGGIGKGLCADIVARELVARGARSAYISLGGDIHAAGEPPETGFWQVPLVHPVSAAIIAEHHLASGGLVMSTVSMRAWKRGGKTVHHIIDPRSGCSTATDVVAVAVAARSAARAEALAKAAIVLGADDGAAFLAARDVTAWVITGTDVVSVEGFSCSQ